MTPLRAAWALAVFLTSNGADLDRNKAHIPSTSVREGVSKPHFWSASAKVSSTAICDFSAKMIRARCRGRVRARRLVDLIRHRVFLNHAEAQPNNRRRRRLSPCGPADLRFLRDDH